MRAMLLTLLLPVCLQATGDDALLLHNPFRQPEARGVIGPQGAATASDELTLRATLTDGGQPLANINGRLIRPGDEVNGYKVEAIDEGSVVLSRGAQERRLTVRNEHIE
jgi:hypothetical protein